MTPLGDGARVRRGTDVRRELPRSGFQRRRSIERGKHGSPLGIRRRHHVVTVASSLPVSDTSLEGASILVAEDSREQAEHTCGTLREAGCFVRLEGDGRAALRALGEERFDLLVTDWMMPGCDGIQLCRSVRAEEEVAGRLYILFLASLDGKEQIAEALSVGADDYLVKPFDPGELLARVRAGLRLVRVQAQLRAANGVLSRLALSDPITELANRRAFDDLLAREASSFERRGTPFCIARIDVDRFKTVNDTHGHDLGDELLSAFARTMRGAIRDEDVAARVGGDEFALLLRACALDTAASICERLRERLAAVQIPTPKDDVSATASIGIASAEGGTSVTQVFAAADEALYAAKARGGDTVAVAHGRPASVS
jgi:diguanylate cyclase (GGDEF)-like protein